MSETPQAILATWLEAGSPTHLPRIRDAIRAVLDLVRVQYETNEEMTRLLKQAEAERDTLRAEIARRDHVAHVNASWRPDR